MTEAVFSLYYFITYIKYIIEPIIPKYGKKAYLFLVTELSMMGKNYDKWFNLLRGFLCVHVSNVLNTSNEPRPKSCKYQIIYEEEKSDSSILFLSFSLSLSRAEVMFIM